MSGAVLASFLLTPGGSGIVSMPAKAHIPVKGVSCPSTLNRPRTGADLNSGGSAEFLNQAPIRSPLPPKVRPRDGIGLSPAASELLANSSLSVFIVPAARMTRFVRAISFFRAW